MSDISEKSELEALKALLFEDEFQHLEKITSKLQTLETETKSTDEITQIVLKHFDDILLKKLAQKESKTIEVLSQYLSKIIAKSASGNKLELSYALQSTIASVLSKEVENNKEKMIDALYPILGGMISRYVAQAIKEMMDSINEKIEDGFSLNKYKRKVKAKVSGVSETELLLEESSDATIYSLFVIHKKSGLLIAEANLENKEIGDPHMVASMASAIKDFINDWIQNHEEESSVQLVSYGKETLYIESAGSVYIIAFLNAEPDYEQRSEINTFFAHLVKRYSRFFQTFNGDDSALEVKILSQKMQAFIDAQRKTSPQTKKEKKSMAKYLVWLLAFGALFYVYIQVEQYYANYRLEQSLLQKTGAQIRVTQEEDTLQLWGELSSMEQFYTIERIMKGKKFINRLEMPVEEIDHKISTLQKEIEELKVLYSEKKSIKGALK